MLLNKKLLGYVKKQRKNKFSDKEIKQKLIESGYPEKYVDRFFFTMRLILIWKYMFVSCVVLLIIITLIKKIDFEKPEEEYVYEELREYENPCPKGEEQCYIDVLDGKSIMLVLDQEQTRGICVHFPEHLKHNCYRNFSKQALTDRIFTEFFLEDIVFECGLFPDRFKTSCYYLVYPKILELGKKCSTLPSEHVLSCQWSAGKYNSEQKSLEIAETYCSSLPTKQKQSCYIGIGDTIAEINYPNFEEAISICKQKTDSENCVVGVGSFYGSVTIDAESKCETISSDIFKAKCSQGVNQNF
ncbi:hypothetical protein HN789_05100 [archaeon]|jgi:hypothetical protein|nr:hypothetical protein [archaeon]MBT4022889.1 hypothetical protein [archaeon]MBT4272536.1 hypothetical protein [archaeon]MBT4460396.1 hypothetical protein [archaeon]MBT4859027.1 hypothetical protein [archaeon]